MTDKKTHLAYVVHTLNPGGTERLVVEMSKAFVADFLVTVICLDEPGVWATKLRRMGIPVYSLWRQPGLDVSVAYRLAKHCRDNDVHIIHAHQCTPWFYAALSRLWNTAPRVMLEEHGRFYPETENLLRRWVNKVLIARLTHRFVAVSRDTRDRLERYEGIGADNVQVVYNGIEEFATISTTRRLEIRRSLGFDESHFIVGTVGRFDPIKNLPLLVRSCAAVMKEAKNLRAVLVGDGPDYPAIERLVNSLRITEKFNLTGFREDARSLVQGMDLFVLPSFSEGTSMALLEAMAAGVPVVVTDVGGNPEIVHAGKTGFIVRSDDEGELTSVLRDAIRDTDRTQAFAKAGQQFVRKNFSFSGMLENYRRIYLQLAEKNTEQ